MTNPAHYPEGAQPESVAVTPDDIRRLVHLVEENGLSELFFESDNVKIVLRTAAFPQKGMLPAGAILAAPTLAPAGEQAHELAQDETESGSEEVVPDEKVFRRIEAPIMGVFYRAAAQDAPPLVDVGDEVTEGQVIGLIEAMKVFSEIPSPIAGRVVEIPGRNGTLVQPGDALILVETE